jgi:hypothetical protein
MGPDGTGNDGAGHDEAAAVTTTAPLLLFAPDRPEGAEAWQIELPLPPKACSPNSGGHAKFHGEEIKAYRQICAAIYRAHSLPKLKAPITVHLEFFYARHKPETRPDLYKWRPRLKRWEFKGCVCHDEDNARGSFKAGFDALQDAGIVERDSRKYVRQGYCTIRGTAKEHQGRTGVTVTIEGERAE